MTIFRPFTFRKFSVTSGPKATPMLLLEGARPAAVWGSLHSVHVPDGLQCDAILREETSVYYKYFPVDDMAKWQ